MAACESLDRVSTGHDLGDIPPSLSPSLSLSGSPFVLISCLDGPPSFLTHFLHCVLLAWQACVLLLTAIGSVLLRYYDSASVDPGMIGFALVYVLQLAGVFQYMVRLSAQVNPTGELSSSPFDTPLQQSHLEKEVVLTLCLFGCCVRSRHR